MVRRQPEEMSSHQPIEMMDKGGSESSRELIQSWLGKLTFLFRKVQLSIQISFILTEPASLLTDSWLQKTNPKRVTKPVKKNPVARFRPWIFVVPQNLLGYLDDHQHLVGSVGEKRAVCCCINGGSGWIAEIHFSCEKKTNSDGTVKNLRKQLLV